MSCTLLCVCFVLVLAGACTQRVKSVCSRFADTIPILSLLQGVKLLGGQGVHCLTDVSRPPSKLQIKMKLPHAWAHTPTNIVPQCSLNLTHPSLIWLLHRHTPLPSAPLFAYIWPFCYLAILSEAGTVDTFHISPSPDFFQSVSLASVLPPAGSLQEPTAT